MIVYNVILNVQIITLFIIWNMFHRWFLFDNNPLLVSHFIGMCMWWEKLKAYKDEFLASLFSLSQPPTTSLVLHLSRIYILYTCIHTYIYIYRYKCICIYIYECIYISFLYNVMYTYLKINKYMYMYIYKMYIYIYIYDISMFKYI